MNNPAAFPIIETASDGSQSIEPGMTLRDYFAAKAMQAFIQASAVMGIETRDEKIAEWAYGQADAMLAERERGGQGMRYRKKPVVIEAKQLTLNSMFEVLEWVRTNGGEAEPFQEDVGLSIDTLEGMMRANEGDWIIRGVNGEFYPCKPNIFEATYERAGE